MGTDMMSLKGQIWPGMGKMDLANEEMKRTRNQRKPKSVIEKMRRTSEGIAPNQVVMSAEFEVERVKGVYDDSSSPVPGQEESVSVIQRSWLTQAKAIRRRHAKLQERSAENRNRSPRSPQTSQGSVGPARVATKHKPQRKPEES